MLPVFQHRSVTPTNEKWSAQWHEVCFGANLDARTWSRQQSWALRSSTVQQRQQFVHFFYVFTMHFSGNSVVTELLLSSLSVVIVVSWDSWPI